MGWGLGEGGILRWRGLKGLEEHAQAYAKHGGLVCREGARKMQLRCTRVRRIGLKGKLSIR